MVYFGHFLHYLEKVSHRGSGTRFYDYGLDNYTSNPLSYREHIPIVVKEPTRGRLLLSYQANYF